MGSNKNLFIILGVAVVALVVTVLSGGLNISEGEDPAQQFISQRGGGVTPTPEPVDATTPAQTDTSPAVTPTETTPQSEVDDSSVGDVALVEGDAASTDIEGNIESAPEAASVEGESEQSLEGAEELDNAGGMEGLDDVESVLEGDDEILSSETFDEEVPSDEDLFIDEEISDDPIERFKDMDPRDIIDAKYSDLEGRMTTPWDEEDLDNFIPMTGRPDPLTRVRDAIPELLMPPREGATDDSQIQLYAASTYASLMIDSMVARLQCYNVLQIGLTKYASFYYGAGFMDTLQEGESLSDGFFTEGVSGSVFMTVSSITPDLVTVNYSATADKVDLGISRTQHFIPSRSY